MISLSPYGDEFNYEIDYEGEKKKVDGFLSSSRKTIVVQGLGFVGSAMVAALSGARDGDGRPLFNVIGVDLPDERNYWKIARANKGLSPIVSLDRDMDAAYRDALGEGNVLATYGPYAYGKAAVVLMDINLDIRKKKLGEPSDYEFNYDSFLKATREVADNIAENALVIIETTVPPGTTEKVAYPAFNESFRSRGLDIDSLRLVHSYERVMPGKDYLNSITNMHRVYSGINDASKAEAREFFESFINTGDYPLTELHSPTASEMAKVLENTFRAMNIAFIQEWTEFAEHSGVNLFAVIGAIRKRPTHRNIMLPGFGVGGYCLPKDALLADWSYRNLFGGSGLDMSLDAIAVNDLMPEYTFDLLRREVGDLRGRRIALMGVSYLNDVADSRFSPAEIFYDRCIQEGAEVTLHDPLVGFWQEKGIKVSTDLASLRGSRQDVVVFTVRHSAYLEISAGEILNIFGGAKIIIDAFDIISDEKASELAGNKVKVIGVGKGHWRGLNG